MKILLIEDNDMLRQSIASFIELAGHEIVTAEDGKTGLTLFKSQFPDLVITDLNMPHLGGKDVIREISEMNDEIPIIVISGENDIYEAIESVHLGAWDYIIKPIYELQVLSHSIDKVNERARLLRKNREYRENLENAKKIMENDLKMAINIQKIYFQQKPPESEEWDVAFKWIPMTGVSGDLYDFYEKDGKLTGISLFDVSGHGIASALITMLAKSIAFRCFKNMHEKPVNEILEFFNSELISEIDTINCYLTGAMLKLTGNSVQYVNAAHPSILHYSTKSGKIIQPDIDSGYRNGRFLGMSIFQNTYHMFEFQVQSNDLILVYSDCLTDAENSDGERYGTERLRRILQSSPCSSTASEILSCIMKDFYLFTGTKTHQDDLTAVLIKRR